MTKDKMIISIVNLNYNSFYVQFIKGYDPSDNICKIIFDKCGHKYKSSREAISKIKSIFKLKKAPPSRYLYSCSERKNFEVIDIK